MPAPQGASQAELDAAARRYGYANYAQLKARQDLEERLRQEQRPRQMTIGDRLSQNLQRVKQNVLSLHPATLLEYARSRMEQATGRRSSSMPTDIHGREVEKQRRRGQ
jgi:hypothetical protein